MAVGFETQLSETSDGDPWGWRRVVPLLVLGVVFLISVLAAQLAWDEANDGCATGIVSEASSSEVLEHRSFPPRWTCRYEFDTGLDGAAIAPAETVVYDAGPTVIFAGASGLVVLTYGVWFVRGVRRPR